MITQRELQEHTARLPFAPFWVRLCDGELIRVTERFKAVAMRDRFAVTTDGRLMRHIPIGRIAELGLLSTQEPQGNIEGQR